MTVRYCMACGQAGNAREVKATLVEVAPDAREPMTVAIPVTFREGAIEERRDVPGIYEAELRCTDRDACRLRVMAMAPPPPEPVVEADALAAWLPPEGEVDDVPGGTHRGGRDGYQPSPSISPGEASEPVFSPDVDEELAAWTN